MTTVKAAAAKQKDISAAPVKKTSKAKTPAARKASLQAAGTNANNNAQGVGPGKVSPSAKGVGSQGKVSPLDLSALKKSLLSKVKEKSAVICFLLDVLPLSESAGLELSAFRRAMLFRDYLGVESWLLTDFYQPSTVQSALKQIALGRLTVAHLANLYDYFQGIDRKAAPVLQDLGVNSAWKAQQVGAGPDMIITDAADNQIMYVRRDPESKALDYINYLREGKILRRDTFDPLGFISRTQFLRQDDGFPHTVLYYRPDHTVALMENYRDNTTKGGVPLVDQISVIDKNGHTIQRFGYHDELVAYWLLQVLGDQKSTYLCIADQLMDYQRYFTELKRQHESYPHVRTMGVSHNCHCVDPLDVQNSRIGDNYLFLIDPHQRMDRVITLTTRQKEDIIKRYGEQAHEISVISHPVPVLPNAEKSYAQSLTLDPMRDLILVGRFANAKNQDAALDVLKLVLEQIPDARLHFYGAGGDEEKIKKRVQDEGLADSVLFHGFVPAMKPVFQSAALLLMTSKHEGFPLVLQEALSLGLPAVAFDCRYGPSEMIEDGKNGYLIPPGDIEVAAAACVKILKDPTLRKQLSKAAVTSMQRFSPENLACQWAQLLLELLDKED